MPRSRRRSRCITGRCSAPTAGRCTSTSLTFVSKAAIENGLAAKLGIQKQLVAVENTRGGIGKKDMILTTPRPTIEVDPETYDVRADGELLVCEPAKVLPMAQRYFLF